jgi:histidyl-tRNA synthetase
MKSIWTVAELDPRKLFEVVPNRDPETSARFSLPVPNWLNADGTLQFQHPDIKLVKKGGKEELRFTFHNYEDGCEQAVKINEQGVIIFTAPTPAQARSLRKIISDYADDPTKLTPADVKGILSRAYGDLGLMDRFNGNRSDITSKMDRIGDEEKDPVLGAFVYKPVISTCVYLSGSGEFQGGPTITPQVFEAGGFVAFPGQSIKDVRALIKVYNPDDHTPKADVKIVSKAVFLKSRRMPDQRPIDMDSIPVQDTQLRKIYKPKPISGFPEWKPEVRDVERQWLRTIAEVFERYGFVNIETPSVEEVAVLTAKGEGADKEIYGLQHLHAAPKTGNDPQIALHYDLTVPMSRYVAQHYSELSFPFKRYQIQKVWRGERPQQGRYREFVQCDIDVVDKNNVSLEFDAEFPVILCNLVKKLDIGNVAIGVSNRKILQGFYQGLGVEDDQIIPVIHVLGNIGKTGDVGVRAILSEEMRLSEEIIDKCIGLAKIKETGSGVTARVMTLGVDTPLLREGLKELDFVMGRLDRLPKGTVVADLSIARDFDYYTGTVYEGKFVDYPDYPVIIAGGRYDNLVGNFMNRSLPGVGISFGLTSIFTKLVEEDRIPAGRKTPTQVLIAVADGATRDIALSIADGLRDRGIPTEVYHEPAKLERQLEYADKKSIPYVILPNPDRPQEHQVKDMRTGVQTRIPVIQDWAPGS